MSAYSRYKNATHYLYGTTDLLLTDIGQDGRKKVNEILEILSREGHPSVLYSKAILAAAEIALERKSTFWMSTDGEENA